MTQDEVLKELHNVIAGNQQFTTWTVSTPHLVELVNRAIKAEREACAKECWKQMGLLPTQAWSVNPYEQCINAIRARGQA